LGLTLAFDEGILTDYFASRKYSLRTKNNCNIYCKSEELRSWDCIWPCQCFSVTSSSNSSDLIWAIVLSRRHRDSAVL